MPPLRTSLLLTLSVVPAGYFLYEKRRLSQQYPARPIPATLQISRRTDRPLMGMSPSNNSEANPEEWKECISGDLFQTFIPRKLLSPPSSSSTSTPEEEDQKMLDSFVRSYWNSFPFTIEKLIINTMLKLGVGAFKKREATPKAPEGSCQPGEFLLDGLFMVEARSATTSPLSRPPSPTTTTFTSTRSDPSLPIVGPLVASWRFANPIFDSPPPPPSSKRTNALLGGYHTFALQSLPVFPGDEEEQMVRLIFTSELAMDSEKKYRRGLIQSAEMEGLPLLERGVMWFHILYSQILLDQAVKGLKKEASSRREL